ncbi:MAG: hypothetical protein ABI883_07185 [Chthoniobacterales bacterium]
MTPARPRLEFVPIFDWSAPRSRTLKLVAFLTGSAVLHALCFYVFQIIYPPTIALLPPPARVHLINPETAEGRGLLRWLEAEDPALSSTTQRPPDAASFTLPQPAHVPSYANYQPALREPPRDQPDLRIPSAQPPGPVRAPRPSVPPLTVPTASTITFANSELLGPATVPKLVFTASGKEPPQAMLFRLAINTSGAVQGCFLENSSGDAALDLQARQHLLLCRFPEFENRKSDATHSLFWTTATIEWGNDLILPPAPAPSSAQP